MGAASPPTPHQRQTISQAIANGPWNDLSLVRIPKANATENTPREIRRTGSQAEPSACRASAASAKSTT